MEAGPGRGCAPLEIGFSEEFIDGQFDLNAKGGRINQPANTGHSFVPSARKHITGPSPCPSEPSYASPGSHPESRQLSHFQNGIMSNMRRHQSQNVIPTGPPKPPRDPKRMSGTKTITFK